VSLCVLGKVRWLGDEKIKARKIEEKSDESQPYNLFG